MGNEHEEVIDTKSGFAYLLVKWRIIVLVALAAGLLGGIFGYMKKAAKPAESVLSYEERVEKARKALPEDTALYVEQLYGQYSEYGKILSDWNRYIENSAMQKLDPRSYVKRDLLYAVESDTPNAVSAFSSSLLGKEEFEKIALAMAEKPSADSISELVEVSDAAAVNQTGMSPSQQRVSDNVIAEISGEETAGNRNMMNIRFFAASEEDVDAMQKVIEARILERQAELTKSAVNVTVRKVDETTSVNDAKWLINMQQTALTPMINMQNNRNNFVKNAVDVLGDKEAAYFALLGTEDTGTAAAASVKASVNKKDVIKFAMAGLAAGALLAIVWLLLVFVFSDKIISEEQLKDNFALPVLQRFVVTGSEKSLESADAIKKKGLSTLGAVDSADSVERGGKVLAYELCRRFGGSDEKKVFLSYDCGRTEIRETVDRLAEYLKGQGISATAGMPVTNEMDFQELLNAETALIVTTLNTSRAGSVKNIKGICQRNQIPVLGCVTLVDASKY